MLHADGWNDASVSELASIVSGVGETAEDALDIMRSYVTNKKTIMDRNSELLKVKADLERSVEDLKVKTEDLNNEISRRRNDEMGKLFAEKDAVLSEIMGLEEKHERMVRELSEASEHIVDLSRLGEIRKRAEDDISYLVKEGESLEMEKQRIQNQIAIMTDLVKFASGIKTLLTSNFSHDSDQDIVIKKLCSPENHGHLSYDQREILRSNMIHLFLKLFEGA